MTEAWVSHLLRWYHSHRRDMPWRGHPQAYAVWVSEIMLQQTQVATVMPYFDRFMQRFPTVRALAKADLQEVLKTWEGLGYYARARNLHRAARVVIDSLGGHIPRSGRELRKLPGIGEYAAAAIASICFGEPLAAVDGNVLRVFARLKGMDDDIGRGRTRKEVRARLERVLPRRAPGTFNQAMMELGALVCRPAGPSCDACPLRRFCAALAAGRVHELPRRAPRPAVPHEEVGVGIVRRNGRILVARRPDHAMLGGLWEFPGGKRGPGEPLEQTVRREVREETGLDVEVAERLCRVDHAYSHFRVSIHAFLCRRARGKAKALGSAEVRWVLPRQLPDLPFPAANRRIMAALDNLLSRA